MLMPGCSVRSAPGGAASSGLGNPRRRTGLVEPGPVNLVDGRPPVFAYEVFLEMQIFRRPVRSSVSIRASLMEGAGCGTPSRSESSRSPGGAERRRQPSRPIEVRRQVTVPSPQLEPGSS